MKTLHRLSIQPMVQFNQMKPTVMSVPPLRCSLGGREEFNLTSGKFHKYSHKDVGRSHYTLFSGRPGACSEIFCDKS